MSIKLKVQHKTGVSTVNGESLDSYVDKCYHYNDMFHMKQYKRRRRVNVFIPARLRFLTWS